MSNLTLDDLPQGTRVKYSKRFLYSCVGGMIGINEKRRGVVEGETRWKGCVRVVWDGWAEYPTASEPANLDMDEEGKETNGR